MATPRPIPDSIGLGGKSAHQENKIVDIRHSKMPKITPKKV
jgi:hypothetical protein